MLLQCMPKYLNCFTYLVFPSLHRTYPDMNPEKSQEKMQKAPTVVVYLLLLEKYKKKFFYKNRYNESCES